MGQQDILQLLQDEDWLTAKQIAKKTDTHVNSVYRSVRKLEEYNLVRTKKIPGNRYQNQKAYKA